MSEAVGYPVTASKSEVKLTRYLWAVFFFCAATSIPMSFSFYVLPASMRAAGQGAAAIGMLALVYIPYALRALWAPLIDKATKGNPFLYRVIVITTTIVANLVVLLLAFADPGNSLAFIIMISLIMFVLLSSGMTALDGYVLSMVAPESRAQFSAWQAAGFTVGAIILGVQSYLLSDASWEWQVLSMTISMFVLAVPTLLLPAEQDDVRIVNDGMYGSSVLRFLKQGEVQRRMLLSVLTHGSVGLIIGYMPIWMVDSGLSAGETGLFGTIGSSIVGLVASVLVGVVTVKLNAWRSIRLVSSVGCVALVSGAFLVNHQVQGYIVLFSFAINGLGYAFVVPYRALVLQLSSGPRRATQAAILSSLDVLISIIAASFAGLAVTSFGLQPVLVAASCACLVGAALARPSTHTR